MLDKQQTKVKSEGKMSSAPAKAGTSLPPVKDAANAASSSNANPTGPNRQRRRPRKLNKEPAPQNENSNIPAAGIDVVPPAATAELEALKSRVRGLEAKVEELYKASGETRGGRSPRRRGKGRKGSGQQVPTSTILESGNVEEIEDEADEELVRLEGELEVARRDLESYHPRPRPRTKRSASGETEYIEEIPRDGIGGAEDTADTGDRQVTLTGSYRIPLPSSVSMEDVKNIQSGVSAAQNVAKSFLEQRRARQAMESPQPPRTATPTPKAKQPSSSSTAVAKAKEDGTQTWSEWFGGYSMAISRAVKNIEAEAAIESQKRPAPASRMKSAPAAKSAPATGKPKASAGTAKSQRPTMKSRTGNLSSEQVHGLMS